MKQKQHIVFSNDINCNQDIIALKFDYGSSIIKAYKRKVCRCHHVGDVAEAFHDSLVKPTDHLCGGKSQLQESNYSSKE
jgi:hypothetical protein